MAKDAYDLAGTLHGLAFLDSSVGSEEHHTDLAGFEVHAHALDAGREPAMLSVLRALACCGVVFLLDQLLSLHVVHAVDTRNTVTVATVSASSYAAMMCIVFHTRRRARGQSRRGQTPPARRVSATPRCCSPAACQYQITTLVSHLSRTSVGAALVSAA